MIFILTRISSFEFLGQFRTQMYVLSVVMLEYCRNGHLIFDYVSSWFLSFIFTPHIDQQHILLILKKSSQSVPHPVHIRMMATVFLTIFPSKVGLIFFPFESGQACDYDRVKPYDFWDDLPRFPQLINRGRTGIWCQDCLMTLTLEVSTDTFTLRGLNCFKEPKAK